MSHKILIFGIISLFLVSALAPMVFGVNIQISNKEELQSTEPLDGPMDSPWPMYCYDVHHTGRSPYSTENNIGTEKWKFWTELSGIPSGIVISNDGTIYFSGSYDLYALHQNGTLKWRFEMIAPVLSCPAIDENGTIYVGTAYVNKNLYAINPDGTLKWKFPAQIFSSPAIGNDGTIYFGSQGSGSPPYSGWINALYPNGTLRWRYKTNHFIYSDPAIGNDGTVYCGSHDGALYALYPNNGTLKWAYGTGDWVASAPSIDDDGTIYFSSWDGYLYAVYPNGTLKWKKGGYLCRTTPIIGDDGTIYAGNTQLSAIYPENGTVKWAFTLGQNEDIRSSNPCISADGTIYFGTFEGGKIYAVNSDGTKKWWASIGGDVASAPAIGEDGTVYIGSQLMNDGYLHAFGNLDPNAPSSPDINGPSNGKVGTEYDYTFTSTSPLGNNVQYYVDWGDGAFVNWVGPYNSGEVAAFSHTWSSQGTFTIKARAKDTDNLWGPWSEFSVNMKVRNRAYSNTLLLRLLEQFPLLREVLSRLITK